MGGEADSEGSLGVIEVDWVGCLCFLWPSIGVQGGSIHFCWLFTWEVMSVIAIGFRCNALARGGSTKLVV